MNLIVAVDNKWGIGYNGELLYNIPEDLKRFAKLTKEAGNVIMGRKTFESIGKCLPKRNNIVITNNKNKVSDSSGALFFNYEESLDYINKNNIEDKVFIIGGDQIYKLFLNSCKFAYVTKILSSKTADSYFPNLDDLDNWIIIEESEEYESNGIKYKFIKYENRW